VCHALLRDDNERARIGKVDPRVMMNMNMNESKSTHSLSACAPPL
jgi:hypothetical protein